MSHSGDPSVLILWKATYHFEQPSHAVDDACLQHVRGEVLGDDYKRLFSPDKMLEDREHGLRTFNLIIADHDVRVLPLDEICFLPKQEVWRAVASLKRVAFGELKLRSQESNRINIVYPIGLTFNRTQEFLCISI